MTVWKGEWSQAQFAAKNWKDVALNQRASYAELAASLWLSIRLQVSNECQRLYWFPYSSTSIEVSNLMKLFVGSLSNMMFPLVVIQTTSIISYQLELVFEFECRVAYFNSPRVILILSPLGMPNEFDLWWANIKEIVQTSTLSPSMHQNIYWTWKLFYANNQFPTKSHVE